MHDWFWRTHFVSLNPQEHFFFSRNPVSSDEEAISIKEDDSFLAKAYELALLASGFSKSKGAFKPCPLGTFTNISSQGRDGCLNCPPGNF